MSRGLIEAGRAGARVSRRSFLKAGMSLGAAAGGGLLLGFSMPAAGGEARRSVIGGDADEPARPGVFAPNAFVQIDR
ncbi:twin-arginine translocation signal domain-containing protein, partial [Burkholderia sp. SIMBA_045]